VNKFARYDGDLARSGLAGLHDRRIAGAIENPAQHGTRQRRHPRSRETAGDIEVECKLGRVVR